MVAYFAAIFSFLYPHGGKDLENIVDPHNIVRASTNLEALR